MPSIAASPSHGMTLARKLTAIAAGYALAIIGGAIVVAIHELLVAPEMSQNSGGMVAFGDMVLFVLTAGFLGLVPSWFLLKLAIERAPRVLLTVLVLIAATGSISWLVVADLTGADAHPPPQAAREWIGLLIVFVAIPRIVLGPVVLAVEATTFLLLRARKARVVLASAMFLDIIPMGLFAAHLAASMHR